MIEKRGKTWHLNRRVPKRYAGVESRKLIKVSLKTDSESAALGKAEAVWRGLLQSWEYALSGDTVTAEQRYLWAMSTAQRMGFDYLPVAEVAKLPIDEILSRIEAASDEQSEDAVLGLAPVPEVRVSDVLSAYLTCYPETEHGKSSDQIRRYRNPRLKVIGDFVAVAGDKPIDKITRGDMLAYRNALVAQIDAGKITSQTANKNMAYFSGMVRGVNKAKSLGIDLPFSDLSVKEGRAGKRGVFSREWITDRLLAPGALDGMGEQARNIVKIMVNTGARPSEIAGIKVKHLRLDGKVPLMDIAPDGRELKNLNSERSIPLAGVSLDAARQALDAACQAGRQGDDWVFPMYAGRDKLSDAVNKFLRENGLKESPKTTLYSLRHSFEDRLIEADVLERVRRDLFGHAINSERYGDGGGDDVRHKAVLSVAL